MLADGMQIELAYLTGAFELWFSILVAATWVPIATIRAHDFLQGLINSVIFAIIIIIGMTARGYALWHTVSGLPFRVACCVKSLCRPRVVPRLSTCDEHSALLLQALVSPAQPFACRRLEDSVSFI